MVGFGGDFAWVVWYVGTLWFAYRGCLGLVFVGVLRLGCLLFEAGLACGLGSGGWCNVFSWCGGCGTRLFRGCWLGLGAVDCCVVGFDVSFVCVGWRWW